MKRITGIITTALILGLTSPSFANSKKDITETQTWIIEANIENMARVELGMYNAKVRENCLLVYTLNYSPGERPKSKKGYEETKENIYNEFWQYSGNSKKSIYDAFRDFRKEFFRKYGKAEGITQEEFEECTMKD